MAFSSASLTVTAPVLVKLSIAGSAGMVVGTTQQFTASGVLSDGTTANLGALNWTTSNSSVVALGTAGVATAIAAGSANISANSAGVASNVIAVSVSTQTATQSCAPAPTSKLLVNVKNPPYNATGDGVTDDTAAIQAAIDMVSGTGGTVQIPDGTYMINPVAKSSVRSHGLEIDGAMTVSLSPGATLQAIATSSDTYAVIMIYPGASNVSVVGGTIQGERSAHLGTTGEWGMGIYVGNTGGSNVFLQGITSVDAWGDGFYVSGGTNVTVCNVTANNNRRNGMSIINVNGMTVTNSAFKNTAGTPPEAGIDIEPDAGETVNNVTISGSQFLGNHGAGFTSGVRFALAGSAAVTNVTFNGNAIADGGVDSLSPQPWVAAIHIANQAGTIVTDNTVSNQTGEGIMLTGNGSMTGANRTVLKGNTVTGTISVPGFTYWSGGGIYLADCPDTIVTGNTVTDNSGFGIIETTPHATITNSGNVVYRNGMTP